MSYVVFYKTEKTRYYNTVLHSLNVIIKYVNLKFKFQIFGFKHQNLQA